MIKLRPYQKEGITKIFKAWDPKQDNLMNVLFQMPTGTGKTTVFSAIVRKAHLKNKKVLIVVHRTELLEQIHDRLSLFGVQVGLISAQKKADTSLDVQVATIQTLSRRKYPPADIVIIDECHHSKARTYKKLWEIYPEARFLGVTATPTRINGDGFDDLFDVLIPLGNLSYFIEKGYLVPIKHLVCTNPDLSSVKSKMRDYDTNMLSEVMLDNSIMADLVDSYLKKIPGKKVIVFAVDVKHSKEIVHVYQEKGVSSAHLDATTPKEERKRILNQFRKGEILVLSNVDIVSEGFDVPDCDAVQLARPTKSLVLYLQQVGRCMRPAKGKENGFVLDNAGLWLEHGISYIDREWTLEGKKKKKRSSILERKNVGFDEFGILREIKIPEQAIGLELTELTEELKRLLIFEGFLRYALNNNHKPVSAIYKYLDYLVERDIEMSDKEVNYCHERLNAVASKQYRIGFLKYRQAEVSQRIKEAGIIVD